jgi:hypothetical protein
MIQVIRNQGHTVQHLWTEFHRIVDPKHSKILWFLI